VEHWNRSGWRVVSSPSPFRGGSLAGVDAVAANDVWAVGRFSISHRRSRTLIEHWNGTRWRHVRSPSPAPRSNELLSVAAVAASDVWAVGTRGHRGTLIEHWNGSRWSIVPSPNVSGRRRHNHLVGVDAVSHSAALAVGYTIYPPGVSDQPLGMRRRGGAWSIVATPHPPGSPAPDTYLQDIAMISAASAFAVGFDFNATGAHPLSEHWNGSRWTLVNVPTPTHALLFGIARIPTSAQYWAVGQKLGNTVTTAIERHC
jgi:hypothetical protein